MLKKRKMKESDFSVKEFTLDDLKDRRIWIPHMCDAAYMFAAVLRSMGHDSEVLARSDDASFKLGRGHTDGEQCLPSIITTEDILQRVFADDFDANREAFFQGKSQGPCRFGRYYMNQQLILHKLGLDKVPILTLDNRNAYGGMGSANKTLAWDGFIGHAVLERMLHFTRPFELNEGESEKTYWGHVGKLCDLIERGIPGESGMPRKLRILFDRHKRNLIYAVKDAYGEFSRIKVRDERKPVVFVTGEIFVRTSSVANEDLIKKIEEHGGVALLEPPSSFFAYVNEHKRRLRRGEFKRRLRTDFRDWSKAEIDSYVMGRDEHDIASVCEDFPRYGALFRDPTPGKVIDLGSMYVHPSFFGESIVTLGESDYFANQVDGVINAMPFNCMPGMVATALREGIRKNNNNIPFLNLSFDGNPDPTRDEHLGVFMYQTKQRMERRLNQ